MKNRRCSGESLAFLSSASWIIIAAGVRDTDVLRWSRSAAEMGGSWQRGPRRSAADGRTLACHDLRAGIARSPPHFAIGAAAMLPISISARWMERSPMGIAAYFGIWGCVPLRIH